MFNCIDEICHLRYYWKLLHKLLILETIKPHLRRNHWRAICRWYQIICRIDQPSSTYELFPSLWTIKQLPILWVYYTSHLHDSSYYNYEAKAGLNSLTLKNRGKRYIKFKTGELLEYNFASEQYCGSFWGPMKVEVGGKMLFQDKQNNIVAELEFDNEILSINFIHT